MRNLGVLKNKSLIWEDFGSYSFQYPNRLENGKENRKARDLLLYHTEDKNVNVSVYFQEGSFWLMQKAMAELFGVKVPAVSKLLKNIFDTDELTEDSVVSISEITAADCKAMLLNISNNGDRFYP